MSFATGLIGSAIGGVGSAIGGVASGIGSLIGGNQQASGYQNAANNANSTLQQTQQQVQTNEAPYTNAGSSAIGQVSSALTNKTGFASPFTMSSFYNDPGYQFTLGQGTNAVNNSAAAKGGLLSGAAAKGLASYTTGLANQTYGDAYNRYLQTSNQNYNQLMGVAGLGQTATGQVNSADVTTGTQMAQNTYNAGVGAANATAQGTYGLATGLGNAAGNTLATYYKANPPSNYYTNNAASFV